MSSKNIIRLVRGLLAGVLLVIAAREATAAGFTVSAALAGAVGLFLLLGAITGKG